MKRKEITSHNTQRKRKIWLRSSMLDDDFLKETEGMNPNTASYAKAYSNSRLKQLMKIKAQIGNLLAKRREVELEGFYKSNGATYYTVLLVPFNNREWEKELDVDYWLNTVMNNEQHLFMELSNRPRSGGYQRVELVEEYEEVLKQSKSR